MSFYIYCTWKRYDLFSALPCKFVFQFVSTTMKIFSAENEMLVWDFVFEAKFSYKSKWDISFWKDEISLKSDNK